MLKRTLIAFGAFITISLFASVAGANTFTQTKSATTPTISQDGFYCLWGRGNYHGWCSKPSPDAGDGTVHAELSVTFDLSTMPRGSSVTFAWLNPSWTINAPTIYPALWSYPLNTFPGSSRQPIKYMTPGAVGTLTRLVFSDGYTYSLSAVSTQNPASLDLVGLGLLQHLQNSTQVTLVGTLQFWLGRAYLDDAAGDDWQHAHGWADSCVNHAHGSANMTGSGTLTIDFNPPGTNAGAPPLSSSSPVTYYLNMRATTNSARQKAAEAA
jgi:hypothetical protein